MRVERNKYGTVRNYSLHNRGKKYKLSKLVIPGILTVGLLAGGISYKTSTNLTPRNNTVNEYGKSYISHIYNSEVKENEFVILDAGCYRDVSLYLDDKIQYCNKNDISLGFVISSDAEVKYEIYDDIEFAKSLIHKYKVDFPIYISIDKIITDNNLNILEKSDLVKSFIDKARANGMYVGICGTDTNLCNFNKYCFDISEYNVYLKKDSDIIKYKGVCALVEELDGSIKSTRDFSISIRNNNLNSKDKFVEDAYYVVGEGDTIDTIAMEFGLSVNDLLKYNEVNIKEVTMGSVLRIPTESQKVEETFRNNVNDYAIKKGVDLSFYQTEIDWEKLRNNVDFTILKATEGTRVDALFESHFQNCEANMIPVGIYSITRATNISEIKQEAQKLVELLKEKNISYPVYIDFEANMSNEYEKEIWDKLVESGNMKEMLNAWADIISEAGYIPGIYCNKSTYKSIYELTNSANNNFLDRFEKWIAGSSSYTEKTNYKAIEDPGSSTSYQNVNIKCNMRQVSEACTGIGAGTEAGYVDFNYCYTDYDLKDYEYKYSFDIKGINNKNVKDILVNIACIGGLVLLSGSTIFIYVKIRSKKNIKAEMYKKM